MMKINIRHERSRDRRKVENLTREAFWNLYVPGCSEHFVLHNMRTHKDFIPELDLVATGDGQIIGNIVYTRGKVITKSGSREVISFGPVSVLPPFQGKGIGSALIGISLHKACELGYKIVCIYGNPKLYSRFGFRCAEKYDITNSEGKFAACLMTLELVSGAARKLSGRFVESPVYQVDENALNKFDAAFPPREKLITESQKEFQILAGLTYSPGKTGL